MSDLRERLAANHLAHIGNYYPDYPTALRETIALIETCERIARREAYLRCAQHITSGDDRVWALKNIAATYRKWAEEADRGGK